ncbi:hypothetical protein GCM10025792_19870 [Pseudonocardia tropica]|jgi:antitoxin (DNA-binding transcriptional repressor) of toxin-antitoxin stability system
MSPVSEAFEVSPDDPDGVAAAIERASKGSRVRVVRQGHAVADIVPIAAAGPGELRPERRDSRHDQVVRDHATRFGAPTLEHYRRIYATAGREWPGEDHIRAHYPVADVS